MDSLLIAGAIIGTLLWGSPSTDPGLYYGMNALLITDWAQTRYIAENPDEYHEINPILGEHPSRSRVDNYFAASWLFNQIVVRELGDKNRRTYQSLVIGFELVMVHNNIGLGIKCSF